MTILKVSYVSPIKDPDTIKTALNTILHSSGSSINILNSPEKITEYNIYNLMTSTFIQSFLKYELMLYRMKYTDDAMNNYLKVHFKRSYIQTVKFISLFLYKVYLLKLKGLFSPINCVGHSFSVDISGIKKIKN